MTGLSSITISGVAGGFEASLPSLLSLTNGVVTFFSDFRHQLPGSHT